MCRRCSGMFDCNVHGCKGHNSILPGVPRYSTGGWQGLQGSIRTEPSHPLVNAQRARFSRAVLQVKRNAAF